MTFHDYITYIGEGLLAGILLCCAVTIVVVIRAIIKETKKKL